MLGDDPGGEGDGVGLADGGIGAKGKLEEVGRAIAVKVIDLQSIGRAHGIEGKITPVGISRTGQRGDQSRSRIGITRKLGGQQRRGGGITQHRAAGAFAQVGDAESIGRLRGGRGGDLGDDEVIAGAGRRDLDGGRAGRRKRKSQHPRGQRQIIDLADQGIRSRLEEPRAIGIEIDRQVIEQQVRLGRSQRHPGALFQK